MDRLLDMSFLQLLWFATKLSVAFGFGALIVGAVVFILVCAFYGILEARQKRKAALHDESIKRWRDRLFSRN